MLGFAIAVAMVLIGVWEFRGGGPGWSDATLFGRPALSIAGGLALLAFGAATVLEDAGRSAAATGAAIIGMIFGVAAAALALFRAPRWATPRWQRQEHRDE